MFKYRLVMPAIAALVLSHNAMQNVTPQAGSFEVASTSQAELDSYRQSTFRTEPAESNGW
ncbi:MAG: hypothetical protein J0L97_11235 [Alphaproteobacteria bacterium]|nr:hypothetical protein [Alphaproteobacteria bacterium]